MYDNHNYPLGADTPDAPWNQEPLPKEEFDVTISQTLSKNTTVTTNDYHLGEIFLETEWEDDHYHTTVCREANNTSDTNWKEAYKQEHCTPLELIKELKYILENDSIVNESKRKYLIKECSNWIEDDLEICEG